jgi:hypothetical protein
MTDLERRISEGLRSMADRAPRPPGGTAHIAKRVAQRRRRRDQIRMGVGAGTLAVVAGIVGATIATRGGTGGLNPVASGSTTVLATIVTTAKQSPSSSTAPAATLGWPRFIGPSSPDWKLQTATQWSAVRQGQDAWPIRFNRSSTWSTGSHAIDGPYVTVHTDVPQPPASALDGMAGDRKVKIRKLRTDATDVWFTEDLDGHRWTTIVRGRGISSAALLDIVAKAEWNSKTELFDLRSVPKGWSLDRWPDKGEPREILLSFERADGARVDVLLSNTPARLGAVAAALSDTAPLVPTKVRGHDGAFFKAEGADNVVTILWPESQMIVAEARATGVSPDELVKLLTDFTDTSAVEAKLQRL